MEIIASSDVIARISALRARFGDGAVAFDADGTLWSGDVGDDMFEAALEEGRLRPSAITQIEIEAREHGISLAGPSAARLAQLHAAYVRGAYPEMRMLEVMTWVFAGSTRREVTELTRAVLAAKNLTTRVQPEAMRVLAWALGENIETYVVSASPRAAVEGALGMLGVGNVEVIASTPLDEGGVMLAAVDRPIPYADAKVTRLRERTRSRIFAAFGDNAFDIPLLCASTLAVAVRPKSRLRVRAGEVPGLVELAMQR